MGQLLNFCYIETVQKRFFLMGRTIALLSALGHVMLNLKVNKKGQKCRVGTNPRPALVELN